MLLRAPVMLNWEAIKCFIFCFFSSACYADRPVVHGNRNSINSPWFTIQSFSHSFSFQDSSSALLSFSIWSFNWQVSACCCLSMRVCLRIHLELQTVRVPVICLRTCVRLQLMTHFAKASLWISFCKTSFSMAFNMKTPPNPCFTVWHSPFRILLRTCLKHAFLSLLNMLAATKSRICSCLRTASCAVRQKNQSALARQIRKYVKMFDQMATGDG